MKPVASEFPKGLVPYRGGHNNITLKLVSEAFQFCRWSWVPRTANGAADFLALRGFQEMGSRVWIDRPPSSLVLVLNKDGLPCPP
ncbi:hypothetical protein DVH24_033130 [Malus domestica]|uniref:RNase H type-1 domain-containing protein n=1 Tax=Malus domestica TaxID=3750 RepID=A0A498JDW3_MALDO|nr:hypothetical protein DVH24_033130 [Malus domestica]